MTALILLLCMPLAVAQEVDAESRIKAAFIYHFCNYINWPASAFESPASPLVIGVVGSDEMLTAIRQATGNRTANERPISVRRVDPASPLQNVQLLFVDTAADKYARDIVSLVEDNAVLVITETETGLELGSAINFVTEDDRVRFDIAPDAIQRQQLSVSAQLLTVARNIREKEY